jgi:hypothetical protein
VLCAKQLINLPAVSVLVTRAPHAEALKRGSMGAESCGKKMQVFEFEVRTWRGSDWGRNIVRSSHVEWALAVVLLLDGAIGPLKIHKGGSCQRESKPFHFVSGH